VSTPSDQIARITAFTAEVLFDLGASDLAVATSLARDFARTIQPRLYRSEAEAMRSGEIPLPQQEHQEVLCF
jgi:hypothetical protein